MDQAYTKGLSVTQHRLIRKLTADEANGKSDTESLALTRLRIVEFARAAARKSKAKRLVGRELAQLLGLHHRKSDDLDAIKAAAEQYEDRPFSRSASESVMALPPNVLQAGESLPEASSATTRDAPQLGPDREDPVVENRLQETPAPSDGGGIWIETEGD
jgi:hypothetical protein